MAANYVTISASDLINRNKTWQEAVEEELNFQRYQKNGLSSNAEFIMSSILYLSICL
jgi:hypothetical protein